MSSCFKTLAFLSSGCIRACSITMLGASNMFIQCHPGTMTFISLCNALLITNDRSSGQFVACGRGSNGWDYRGLLVDESMIVLRKRIHEMKVMERNYEPPAEWMELEKQYYVCYDEFVCKFVGFLQTQLMNTRPSMALGMLVIITISVPTSALVIVARLIEAAHGVLPGFHLS
ncbi:unnamed protein product [Ilex paraguariensis]|uniref:Uncharacterized protein n=1 Tax=Ilex paraguariensis TaxID=185542 RepID=A0ABC8S5X4_9AQUA